MARSEIHIYFDEEDNISELIITSDNKKIHLDDKKDLEELLPEVAELLERVLQIGGVI